MEENNSTEHEKKQSWFFLCASCMDSGCCPDVAASIERSVRNIQTVTKKMEYLQYQIEEQSLQIEKAKLALRHCSQMLEDTSKAIDPNNEKVEEKDTEK